MKGFIRYLASLSVIIGLHCALGYWTLFWKPELKAIESDMSFMMVSMVPAPPAPEPPKPKPPEPAPEPEIIRVKKPKIVHPKTKPLDPPKAAQPVTTEEAPVQDNTVVDNTLRNMETNWQGKLFSRLARFKKYPEAAKRRGIEGTVKVRFTVNTLGKVLAVDLVAGSGSELLDKAAIDLVKRAAPLPPPPIHMIKNGVAEVVAPIRFELNRGGRHGKRS